MQTQTKHATLTHREITTQHLMPTVHYVKSALLDTELQSLLLQYPWVRAGIFPGMGKLGVQGLKSHSGVQRGGRGGEQSPQKATIGCENNP